jgi:hypothetical protein
LFYHTSTQITVYTGIPHELSNAVAERAPHPRYPHPFFPQPEHTDELLKFSVPITIPEGSEGCGQP